MIAVTNARRNGVTGSEYISATGMQSRNDDAEISKMSPEILITDLKLMVFIPPLSDMPWLCSSGFRDSGATRTLDPQLRRLLLYPTELRNRTAVYKKPRQI